MSHFPKAMAYLRQAAWPLALALVLSVNGCSGTPRDVPPAPTGADRRQWRGAGAIGQCRPAAGGRRGR